MKRESQKLFLDFLREPADSPRRQQAGVYAMHDIPTGFGPVRIFLLDLRYHRTAETLLGPEQWAWLEHELSKPAALRILASSIQLVSSEHRWEKWANHPHEKARLYNLIDDLRIENLVVISGDMHFAELSAEYTPGGRRIFDLTASGLNHAESGTHFPNRRREAIYDLSSHFGLLSFDGTAVAMEIRDEEGRVKIRSVKTESPLLQSRWPGR